VSYLAGGKRSGGGGELEGWLTAAGFTTERLSHAEALSRLGATRPRVDRVVVDGGSHSGSLELLPHFRAAGVPVTLLLEAEDCWRSSWACSGARRAS
jgi:predicted XRE-type DNA-binding protein